MTCAHLAAPVPEDLARPSTSDGCPLCVAGGFRDWVHLRQCLTCGQVGCCDSSPRRHATAHHNQTGHPVIRSIEPGEYWRWCYVDDALG